eukprot:gnl/Chilomastix_cuspidata/4391.p1 GENE.gnl/Chilomastix_cuspidata/4391~~gnl/Chilomastix_cuspidata/4391.p1  ORF type:complete len:5137 (+),score=567.95 gnl/Chilomastix_cuspidata/4391:1094-15412(+)
MSPLLERTAGLISARIIDALNVDKLFVMPPKEALALVLVARKCCLNWREAYFETRASLEKSGRNKRWEFARSALFSKTDFISSRCEELETILKVVAQFNTLVGPSLQAITGDARGFKKLSDRTRTLAQPIRDAAPFIWDIESTDEWTKAVDTFQKGVDAAKTQAYAYIDQSFSKLSSVEATLSLILQFQGMSVDDTLLAQHMQEKLENILEQYAKEIEDVRQLFSLQKESPPITRDMPPVSGRILWVRSLFIKVKAPYKQIQDLPNAFQDSAIGENVMNSFQELGREMRAFEADLFRKWSEEADALTMNGLRSPLLNEGRVTRAQDMLFEVAKKWTKMNARNNPSAFDLQESHGSEDEEEGEATLVASGAARQQKPRRRADMIHMPGSEEMIDKKSAAFVRLHKEFVRRADYLPVLEAEADLTGATYSFLTVSDLLTSEAYEIQVNFTPALLELIEEARMLSKLGFVVSDTTMNIVLQERKYRAYCDGLANLLNTTKTALHGLTPLERKLTKIPMSKLAVALRPGFGPLNWNSLAVQDFISSALEAVGEFQQVIGQLKKISTSIQNSVTLISRINLMPENKILEMASENIRNGMNPTKAALTAINTTTDSQAAAFAAAMKDAQRRAARMKEVASAAERGVQTIVSMTRPISYAFENVLAIEELSTILNVFRENELLNAIEKFRTIPPLLTKAEESLFGSSTQNRPEMKEYYLHWDKQIFLAISRMILTSLLTLQTLLHVSEDNDLDEVLPPPLFKVTAALASPEILFTPSLPVIQNTLSQQVQAIVDSTISFLHWAHGSCIETKPEPLSAENQVEAEDPSSGLIVVSPEKLFAYKKSFIDKSSAKRAASASGESAQGARLTGEASQDREQCVYSFYNEIVRYKSVANARFVCNQSIQLAFTNLQRFFQSWAKYSNIWKINRTTALTKFIQSKPDIVKFDATLSNYNKLYSDFTAAAAKTIDAVVPTIKQSDFILINCYMLVSSIANESRLWVRSIGHAIANQVRPQLTAISLEMDNLIKGLLQRPDNLDRLQQILAHIEESRTLTMDFDLKMQPVIDFYAVLKRHGYYRADPHGFQPQQPDVTAYSNEILEILKTFHLGISAESLASLFDSVRDLISRASATPGSSRSGARRSTPALGQQRAPMRGKDGGIRISSLDSSLDPVVVVTRTEINAASLLPHRWETIQKLAIRVDKALGQIKEKFRAVTVQNADNFHQSVTNFVNRYLREGPDIYLNRPKLSENPTDDEIENRKKWEPNVSKALQAFYTLSEPLTKLLKKREAIQLAQRLFRLEETPYEELTRIERQITTYSVIFEVFEEIQTTLKAWEDLLFTALDVKEIETGLERLFYKLRKLPTDLRDHCAYKEIEKILLQFKESIPLFLDLRSEALRPRHWAQVAEVTGGKLTLEGDAISNLTLGQLLTMELHRFSDEIGDITNSALKELAIEKGINEIAETWGKIQLPLVIYKNSQGNNRGYILKSLDEILQALEDNTMGLQSMSSSRFVRPFAESVREWEKKLSLVADVCEAWLAAQRQWLYLEGIFIGSEDIRTQLPEEAKKFENVDKSFTKLMVETSKNTLAMDACQATGRLSLLQTLTQQMDACQKSLTEYLNGKRSAFPRFYFISDDELLSVLGTSDPTAIQDHIIKMFDCTKSLEFKTGPSSQLVSALNSKKGEILELVEPVAVTGPIENWMLNVQKAMLLAVWTVIKRGVFEHGHFDRDEWIKKTHGQVTLTSSKIWWTWYVEDAFRKVRKGNPHAMKQLSKRLSNQIQDLTKMVRSPLDAKTRDKVNTLIIIDVHSRDIVDRFVRDSILDESEFDWESQMRFYWDRDLDNVVMRQCTGTYSYSYEYSGLASRLVITPLTDRCIMTLTQALRMYLGGSPAGPAGTGKTETVKDLAKHLGRMCQVVNCSEGIDYKAMGSLFCGLCENACWGCFDEFNRIDASVLSVISAQIKQIQQALQAQYTRFIFEGREIQLGDTTGIFITMNPGYAGRTELPDNLKALFRPVTMVRPDLELICENMLFSQGFGNARVLAKKMTVLYNLASEQLSKQYHYDFGLRALKSVLVMAGSLKRGNPEHDEQAVLMRALRDMNLPKFIFEDVPLFLGLIADLFPGLDCPRQRYEDLNNAVCEAVKNADLEMLDDQVDKVVQFYETLTARHAVMIVGPTGGGKTVVVEMLKEALTLMGKKTTLYTLNPKAQTVNELYGILNPDTREWTDGLLSNIFRKINQPLPPERKNEIHYIVFDGDVDACARNDTPIQLFSGEIIPIGSVSVDTILMGPDGSPRRIKTVTRGSASLVELVVEGVEQSVFVTPNHIVILAEKEPRDGSTRQVLEIQATNLLALFSRHVDAVQGGMTLEELTARFGVPFVDPGTEELVIRPLSTVSSSVTPEEPYTGLQLEHTKQDASSATLNHIISRNDVHLLGNGMVFHNCWIETMNSVMDDNKLLTLPNGERIHLQDHCKLIFEVSDLQYASPATISRCGMVWVDTKNLGYRPYFNRWVRGKDPKQADVLKTLFDKYVPPLIDRIIEGIRDGEPGKPLKQAIPQTDLNLVRQLCAVFDEVMNAGQKAMEVKKAKKKVASLQKTDSMDNLFGDIMNKAQVAPQTDTILNMTDFYSLEAVMIFSIVFSLGATVDEVDRDEFDGMIKEISSLPTVETEGTPVGPGQLPAVEPTLFEYRYDVVKAQWIPWSDSVEPYEPPVDGLFASILVPTVDTVRNDWFLNLLVGAGKPVLFVGVSGTAKTTCVKGFFNTLDDEKFTTLTINFSSRTTAIDVQRSIEDNIEKRIKGIYGPPLGKKLLIFVDELNMPNIDIYGTQEPIALLKLLLGKGGFYDRNPKNLNWKRLLDLQLIGAMVPPGGGRNSVDPRFVSFFNCFNVTFPSDSSVHHIYESILAAHLEPFANSVRALVEPITDSTLSLYKSIINALPPTPSKFHYVFNLRDLSRVFEILCLSTPEKFESAEQFVRLWRNESIRVFGDRLILDEDISFVSGKINELVTENFVGIETETVLRNPLLFGDFAAASQLIEFWEDKKMMSGNEDDTALSGEGEIPRLYEDLVSPSDIRTVLTSVLDSYNRQHRKMNIVLFDEAIMHLSRIHRAIRVPRGNALLIGVGGSGRQSLARLATFMAGYELFEIALCRGYGESEFREDLKGLYQSLGVENKKISFLFTDQQIVDESFLELINNILTSGMVPALFTEDEKQTIIGHVRPEVLKMGIFDSTDNCWNFFVDKCRNNLHVILCMSPAGEALRKRCRAFPGLISSCTIDWFQPWPPEALEAVATHFLENEDLPAEHKKSIIDHIVYTHQTAIQYGKQYEEELRRHTHASPKNYLNFINTYASMLAKKRKTFSKLIDRLEGGTKKLEQASKEVDNLQVQLEEQKIQLTKKTEACNTILKKIEEQTVETNAKQKLANESEIQLQKQHEIIVVEKAEAEAGLAEAIPALEKAEEALNNLTKDDITEIRAFKQPPPLVQYVCECVVILKRLPDVSWKGAKGMMSGVNFIGSLIDFNKATLTAKAVSTVENKYIKKRKMTIDAMSSVSKAGCGLLEWVIAMINFFHVDRGVAPKRRRVELAEKQLEQSQQELEQIKRELEFLKSESKRLAAELEQATLDQQRLESEAAIMQRRLDAAQRLLGGLGSEQKRWSEEKTELNVDLINLIGDCLVTSGFLSYAGGFTFNYRQKMIYGDWIEKLTELGIPHSESFKVEKLLTSNVEISQWASKGLPSDELSVQNGILITSAARFPLMIDPQLQTTNWIKQKEAKSNLKICTFNDPDFLKHLELAIMYGQPFLFENVDEELDPVIDPVLEKDVRVEGNRRFIILGDREVDWDDSFRLYLTTKMSNPRFGPSVFGKTSVVNHLVTEDGLETQLLNEVVAHERADLEEKRETLVQSMAEARTLLKSLEDSLLRELASSTGLILDNDELIATLENTKTKANEIKTQLEDMQETATAIDVARNQYRPAAKRGAALFFVMTSLNSINSMYEYSLNSFLSVFRRSLSQAEADAEVEIRLDNIIKKVTDNVYDYVCTSLFERHKLMFSLAMTIKILQLHDDVNSNEFDFFLRGNMSLEKPEKNKVVPWITDRQWADLLKLENVNETFQGIVSDLEKKTEVWKGWWDRDAPEKAPIPFNSNDLTAMQRLCILRCFRSDRVYVGISNFVSSKMGPRYVQPPILDYEKLYFQSTAENPIVFILSPGADPTTDIFKLGEKMGFTGNKLKFLSLGQGQAAIAEQYVTTAVTRGQWVLLMNAHLLHKWLRRLEALLDGVEEYHKDFRLWITTEPTEHFPLGILQRSMKVVTEPPNGLRMNMLQSYSRITDDLLASCSSELFPPLVYVLAFFHAVVQERRKYGKIGYNVPYDFNNSDFSVSLELLATYTDRGKGDNAYAAPPWDSLRYLIGEVMYGGRVTDDFDRRILVTYLEEYLGDFLFEDSQPFAFYASKIGDIVYKVPREAHSVEEYIENINGLPLSNSPEVFGLHLNAEIRYMEDATRTIWTNMIAIQPRTAATEGGVSREEFIAGVARDIQRRMMEPFDLVIIRKQIEFPSPTDIVLLQEMERFNMLLLTISASLKNLQRALSGEIGMSAQLDELANAIFSGTVPSEWLRHAPQTLKPLGSWILHFIRRYDQYRTWLDEGEPAVIWLSGLHIPESYLTALVQTACRERSWPLDRSTLYTRVTRLRDPAAVKQRPEFGCIVQGLFLEGASWDDERGMLMRQRPKELISELPLVEVIPVEQARLRLRNTFRAPVYVTEARRNAMGVGLVFEADISTTEHASHWVLQGCAIVLNDS